VPGIVEKDKFTFGAAGDFWYQDIYGTGAAVSLEANYLIYKGFGLSLQGGWKDRGCLIGKRLEQSLSLFGGCSYRF
jgi:hypothetical protein